MSLFVVYPERDFLPPRVRAFVEALLAWAMERDGSTKARTVAPAQTTRRVIPGGGRRPLRRS